MEQGNGNVANTPTVNVPVANTPTPQASSPVTANPPAKDDVVFTNKPKKNRAMVLGMVFLGILAVGGIGFGVWEMMDGNSQKEQLNSQISVLKSQNNELQEKIDSNIGGSTVVDIDADNSDGSNAVGGPYIDNGYFNVPEWGLKFKIPSDLANYGYSVDYDAAHVNYTLPEIGFTAMLKSDELQGAQAAYYDNIQTCSIVNVSKESGTWPDDRKINGQVKQFDDYALLIWDYSSHGSCDYKLHIDEVQAKIQEMFSNPEAY
ncbi:hypothetical protein IJH72_00020 [Candidatus Saccharibacteria bacterium]|nr:hypothetical protein [Candidatus Saccharibacteria bacterium]